MFNFSKQNKKMDSLTLMRLEREYTLSQINVSIILKNILTFVQYSDICN